MKHYTSRALIAICTASSFTVVSLLGLAGPAAANSDGTYEVRTNAGVLNVRDAPTTEGSRITGFVRRGDQVRIYCTAYDSHGALWDRIGHTEDGSGRFVKDEFVSTGTSAPVAASCSDAEQDDDLRLMEEMRRRGGPAPNEFSYHFHQPVGDLDPRTLGVTPESITTDLVTDFDANFKFPGCGQLIRQDQECDLDVHGFRSPIHINQIWSTGFRFTSLPGHPEGPDRTITFQFSWDSFSRRIFLDVTAVGPGGNLTATGPGRELSRLAVSEDWPAFARDLGRKYGLSTLDRYVEGLQNGE